mmetsp:Transcript_7763/g.19855  ORF Transcript_7763/g.19855 Transcript_7763/m.19855 type:complete len:469 (+) Transcript_7763:118-1524(+)
MRFDVKCGLGLAEGQSGQNKSLSLLRFPLRAPDFGNNRSGWTLSSASPPGDAPSSGPISSSSHPPSHQGPLELRCGATGGAGDGDCSETFEGKLEGGQRAHYYFFVKSGDSFYAVPCQAWYNFKPKRGDDNARGEADGDGEKQSVDVERLMKERRDFVSSRSLAKKLAASDPGADAKQKKSLGPGSIEVEDADALKRLRSASSGRSLAASSFHGTKGGEEGDFFTNQGTGEEEDWEHEQEFDDDDERVEVEAEDFTEEERKKQTTSGAPTRKKANKDEDEGGSLLEALEGGGDGLGGDEEVLEEMERKEKEMQKALSKIGLEEEKDGQADGDANKDDQNMPSLQTKKADPSTSSQSASNNNNSRKTKRSTEDADAGPSDSKRDEQNQAKRAKVSAPPPAPVEPTGPPTERDIEEFLRLRGKMLSTELIGHFKKRLKSAQDNSKFLKAVKRVAKLESEGPRKFVVLKEE